MLKADGYSRETRAMARTIRVSRLGALMLALPSCIAPPSESPDHEDASPVQAAANEAEIVRGDTNERRRHLSPGQIQDTVMSRYGEFVDCYKPALRRGLRQAHLTLAFEVAPDGNVTEVGVTATDIEDEAMIDCVKENFHALRFPLAERSTSAAYPFVFRP
jgi:hypothetical protein